MRKELALSRGQAHGVNADGRRSAADWVERCIDGRVLEAVRERGQQVSHHPSLLLVFLSQLCQYDSCLESRSTVWWVLAVSTLPCSSEAWPYLGAAIPLLGGFPVFVFYFLE